MMRSRSRIDRCAHCGAATKFERELVGPRGGRLGFEPCCVPCGENPARRTGVFRQAVDIVRADAGQAPQQPLTEALLSEAEKTVRGDAMLAATVGLYRVTPEQQLHDARQHEIQREFKW